MIELDASTLKNEPGCQPTAGDSSKSQIPTTFPSARLSLAIVLPTLVALAITAYLVSVAMNSSKIAGCGGGQIFDCNDVVNSRWSRLLGVPVSMLALGLYSSVLVATFAGLSAKLSDASRNFAWQVVIFGGFSAGLAAIWFTFLQFFVVKHLCSYCLAAHTCGLIIAGILIWNRPLGVKTMCKLAMLGLVGVGMLIGGQLAIRPVTHQIIEYDVPKNEEPSGEIFEFVPPAAISTSTDDGHSSLPSPVLQFVTLHPSVFMFGMTVSPQENTKPSSVAVPEKGKQDERRLVSMQGGGIQLDVKQWPLLGKPNAKYVFIEMFDYTCDHCRRTHAAIAGAKQKLGDDLAVIVLPVPLNTKCNSSITNTGPQMVESCEIAQLAIAVWRVAPEKFPEFHKYLMTTTSTPTLVGSKSKAIEMLGTEKTGNLPSLVERLETELLGKVPGQYVAQHVQLYQRVGAGTLPKMMFPGTSIVGEFTSGDELVKIIEQQLK